MKILLTGGSGFIGRNIFESFKDKYSIFVPSHKELDVTNFSEVEKYIKEKKINVVIHSAIKGGSNVFEDTLRMFISILRNIERLDKVIHFGSGAEYDKTRDLIKVKEQNFGKYIPKDEYGLAKYACSLLSQNQKKIVNLRLFGIYGKYEDYRFKFISNSIVKNLLGMPINIKQDVIFDYLYIDDLMPVLDYFLMNDFKHSSYNITPKESISLKKIAQIINQISNRQSEIKIINRGYNFEYTGNNGLLLNEMKDLKFTSYKSGIKYLVDYYSSLSDFDVKFIAEDSFFKRAKIRTKQ